MKYFTYLLYSLPLLFIPRYLGGQNCFGPSQYITSKATFSFIKSVSPNRIIAGGTYYTSTQGYANIGNDTLYPRSGDVLTVFAAILDTNLGVIRMFNVIGFNSLGGSFNDTRVWDMHADASGNIYFSGAFSQDTLLSYFNDTIYSEGYQEAFIVRCDTMGNTTLLKSCGTRTWGTPYTYEDRAHSITSDAAGNIIFTVGGEGSYFTINGDTCNSTQFVGLNSYGDIFVVSLYPNGQTRWIKNCGTPFRDDAAYDVDANAQGYISLTGAVSGSNTVFHFGSLMHTFIYNQYGRHGFVGKLDPNGVPVWLSPIEIYYPSGPDVGAYATVIDDAGYVYASGYFDSWAIFNGDTISTMNATSNYFSKYDLNGQTMFVKLGNIDTFYPYPIYMDELNGQFIISGQSYTNQLTFGSYGQCCSMEAYVVVYDDNGQVLWLRGNQSLGSSNTGFGMACLLSNGNAMVTGFVSNGSIILSPIQINGSSALSFVVKYAPLASNGLSLSVVNNGNDTITCGYSTVLQRTIIPSNGPTLTWWADNDTIVNPNSNTNHTATPKINTLYVATAFYNGCTVSDSVRIYVTPLPVYAGSDTLICSGQSLQLQGNTWPGAVYTWMPATAVSDSSVSNPFFLAGQGEWLSYTVTRAGCSSMDSLLVDVELLPVADFSFGSNLLQVQFTNLSLNYDSIWWDFGDGTFSDSISPVHEYQANGLFTVCMYAVNTCGTITFCADVNLTMVRLENATVYTGVRPVPDGYEIYSSGKIGEVHVFDTCGKTILYTSIESNTGILRRSTLPSGCYLVKVGEKFFKLIF